MDYQLGCYILLFLSSSDSTGLYDSQYSMDSRVILLTMLVFHTCIGANNHGINAGRNFASNEPIRRCEHGVFISGKGIWTTNARASSSYECRQSCQDTPGCIEWRRHISHGSCDLFSKIYARSPNYNDYISGSAYCTLETDKGETFNQNY